MVWCFKVPAFMFHRTAVRSLASSVLGKITLPVQRSAAYFKSANYHVSPSFRVCCAWVCRAVGYITGEFDGPGVNSFSKCPVSSCPEPCCLAWTNIPHQQHTLRPWVDPEDGIRQEEAQGAKNTACLVLVLGLDSRSSCPILRLRISS